MLRYIKLWYLDLKYNVVKPIYNYLWLLFLFTPKNLWYKLRINKDEFHKSLNLDMGAMLHMNDKQLENYRRDVINENFEIIISEIQQLQDKIREMECRHFP